VILGEVAPSTPPGRDRYVDFLRGASIGGHPRVRYLNVAFVLLLPHQLGHFSGEGSAPLWPVGLDHQTTPSLRWWSERAVWMVVPGAILVVIVAVFGRFETRGHRVRADR